MDVWIQGLVDKNKLLTLSSISRAYEITAVLISFRKLAVGMPRFVLDTNSEHALENWPSKDIYEMLVPKPELMHDLLKSMSEMRMALDPRTKSRCYCHCHANGESSYAEEGD